MNTFQKRSDQLVQRASSVTQQHAYRRGPRVIAIETLVPHDIMPGLLALRVHAEF